jgi:glucose-1-phosphate thymidylyltransferase
MHAFILAGGYATRLWPLTEKRAKPLLPLAGKPMMTHIVEQLPAEMPVTVSTNAAFADAFAQWEKTLSRKVDVVIEQTRSEDEKLGNMGALKQWMEMKNIQEDILLLAGDNYLGFNMSDFLARYTDGTPLLAIYDIKDLSQATRFGNIILKDDAKTMAAFEEKPKNPKSTLVSTTCSVLPKQHFPFILDYCAANKDNPGGLWEAFLKHGDTVECFDFDQPWFDIGSFEAYLEATRVLVGDTLISAQAVFENSMREGSVVLGKGTKVINSTLRNVVVFDDCTIDDCILEDCVIDSHCVLRRADITGKMIREGTRLERKQEF